MWSKQNCIASHCRSLGGTIYILLDANVALLIPYKKSMKFKSVPSNCWIMQVFFQCVDTIRVFIKWWLFNQISTTFEPQLQAQLHSLGHFYYIGRLGCKRCLTSQCSKMDPGLGMNWEIGMQESKLGSKSRDLNWALVHNGSVYLGTSSQVLPYVKSQLKVTNIPTW